MAAATTTRNAISRRARSERGISRPRAAGSPTPRTVSTKRGLAGSSPSLRRRLATWTSTRWSSPTYSGPHSALEERLARRPRCPGSRASSASRLNSSAVSSTGAPSTRTRRRPSSISRPVGRRAVGARARRRLPGPVAPACAGARPPEQGLDPGHDLARRERLHEVVVRADREAHDPVDLLAAGREHQHVGVGEGAEPAADLDAVEAREHHVEDDDVGVEAAGRPSRAVEPVAGALHEPALALEVAGDQLDDGRLVVDDEDPVGTQLHARSVPPASGATIARTARCEARSESERHETPREHHSSRTRRRVRQDEAMTVRPVPRA